MVYRLVHRATGKAATRRPGREFLQVVAALFTGEPAASTWRNRDLPAPTRKGCRLGMAKPYQCRIPRGPTLKVLGRMGQVAVGQGLRRPGSGRCPCQPHGMSPFQDREQPPFRATPRGRVKHRGTMCFSRAEAQRQGQGSGWERPQGPAAPQNQPYQRTRMVCQGSDLRVCVANRNHESEHHAPRRQPHHSAYSGEPGWDPQVVLRQGGPGRCRVNTWNTVLRLRSRNTSPDSTVRATIT